MTKLHERISALEGDLLADDDDVSPILVRCKSGRIDGPEFVDDDIDGVRHDDGRLTPRLPGEPLAALVARAAAAVPAGHPRRRPVLLATYTGARDAA